MSTAILSAADNNADNNTNEHIPFGIRTLEWNEQNRDQQLVCRHMQNQFEVIWVQEGAGLHIIDQQQYQLHPKTMYCAVPGQQHQLILQPGSTGYIISFKASFLNPGSADHDMMHEAGFFQQCSVVPGITIDNEEREQEMLDIVTRLIKETDNYFLLRKEILNRYLNIFLIYLRRQFETMQPGGIQENNNTVLKNFFLLLENNFKKKKAVADYAKELFITPSHLNYIIKRTSGRPASYHIRQRIIREAKRQVQYTSASMKEIAYYLGFENMAHFSKFFKSTCGMNFTDFRRSAAGNYVNT